MSAPPRVLVIGGGVAGPALAVFLARAGVEPLLFEAYPRAEGVGGAFQIAPNGVRVLAALGVADEAWSAGHPAHGFAFKNHLGQTIGVVPASRSGPALNIARAPLHAVLEQALAREGLGVHHERRLAAIETDASGVTAIFEDGSRERGDLLVGADGVHSRVRAWMLPDEAAPRDTKMVAIGAYCAPGFSPTVPDEDHLRVTFLAGPKHQFGYMRMVNATWAWWCHVAVADARERDELMTMPGDALRDRMLARYRGWAAPAEAMIASSARWLRNTIHDVPHLSTWHRGRVVLLGDAAHAMSSAGGQGASMALEDAMLLGQLLRAHPYSEAFAAFARARKSRAEAFIRQAYANDRRTLDEHGPAHLWLRDHLFMPLISRFLARSLEYVYAGEPALRALPSVGAPTGLAAG